MRDAEEPPPQAGPWPGAADLDLTVQRRASAASIPGDEQFLRWARAAARGRAGELTIRIVDEDESRALNREYRGRDRPTNVLSFPLEVPPDVPVRMLGDLVICAPVVQREAAEQGKPPQAHWAHLVIHGVLHLLGYDHESAEQARRMEAEEIRILAALGFDNPYEVWR